VRAVAGAGRVTTHGAPTSYAPHPCVVVGAPHATPGDAERARALLDRYAPPFDRPWSRLAGLGPGGTFVYAAWPSPAAEAFGVLLADVLDGAAEPPDHQFADIGRHWVVEHEVWASFAPMVTGLTGRGVHAEVSWLDDGPLIALCADGAVLHVYNGVWSSDSTLAVMLASDKWKTREFLGRLNVPVAEGRQPPLPALLGAAAGELGYPVALKWRYGSNSVGLAPLVSGPAELADCLDLLADVCPARDLFVERHVTGRYLRAFVIDGTLLRISEGHPAVVVGDGRRPLRDLAGLESANATAEGTRRLSALLAGQGAHPDTVVPEGGRVQVSPATRDWSTVPPGSAEWAALAAVAERVGTALAPSILGIDVILTPLGEVVVLEVNAAPGYWFHDDQAGLADVLVRRALARLGVAS